jgi:nitrite reductase (NADH) large subunit
MSGPAQGAPAPWVAVCKLEDILPDTGVCAQVGSCQVAVFRVDDAVYAIDNFDPASGANVLSRGIVGDLNGELVVASPIYKQHFSLTTGRCLEEPEHSVAVFAARVVEGTVWVQHAGGVGRGSGADARTDEGAGSAEADERVSARKGVSARQRGSANERATVKYASSAKQRLVVIGNGMAGMRTVEELRTIAPDRYHIEVFGAEPHGNYNRIMLSPVLAGEKHIDDIMLHPLAWYVEQGVTLHRDDPVVAIDRDRGCVNARSGTEACYDRLLIATGSKPAVPAVPGCDLPGVVTFRDIKDVDAMVAAARTHTHAVVIGAGLLGLEAANGLKARGMDVTVVHIHDLIMERQLDRVAAGMLKVSLEQRGIKFHMPARTRSFSGVERVTGVCFEDGSELRADLVVVAIGIRPNVALAEAAGLCTERGIVVDDTMQSSDPSIYAVGECVQHRDRTYGLVAPLWEQARVCARHLADLGGPQYEGSLLSTQLKVTGIQLFSAGDIRHSAGSESLVFNDARRGVYKRVIIEDDKVRGAVLYGDTKDGARYLDMIADGRPIGRLRNTLLFGEAHSAAS